MTLNSYILPMTKPPTIYFLIYDGFELLDLSGPSGVFSSTNDIAGETLYQIKVISIDGGMIESNIQIEIFSQALDTVHFDKLDTLLITGAFQEPLLEAINNPEHLAFLQNTAKLNIRMGSICSGVFLLANAGLIDGKQVTTHWQASKQLQQYYPRAKVKQDALYVIDGKLWTSAGVTTGIDMSLAMLEKDHGKPLKGKVARQLIVNTHRSGYQSQFSSLLDMQLKSNNVFNDLIIWIDNNLHRTITVEKMADQVNMSERTFHRRFNKSFLITPFKYVETMRLQRARDFLEEGTSIKAVYPNVGFNSASGFRTAFEKHFGVPPSKYKKSQSANINHIM